jgi:hypothetical protein
MAVAQVDFRLSTPRTRWDIRYPEKKGAAPVTFSLMDITLAIVDPIVPACHLFDRVRYSHRSVLPSFSSLCLCLFGPHSLSCRDIKIDVGRIRLAAGEMQTPTTALESLQKVIWDQCQIHQIDSQASVDRSRVLSPNQTPLMMALKIHEDPEMNVTTVRSSRGGNLSILCCSLPFL